MSSLFASLDATAQAELVARGDASARELVDAAIEVIERLNPEIHAVIHPAFDAARERAASRELSGPLRGVPILMKDIGGAEAGRPNHAGMKALKQAGFSESADSHVTTRLKAAGCISLGRTNTPELAILGTTECQAYGATGNPWCPTHSAGGSSGGSGAAVAAGMVAAAHGSDGGGSIRGPASMCGVVGLKPSRGRVSLAPSLGERWSGLSAEFMLTRSIRDTATFLDVLSGPAVGDPYAAPTPRRPYRDEVGADPGKLRIGMLDQSLRDVPLHADCARTVRATGQLLSTLGHLVEPHYPTALDDPEQVLHFAAIVAVNTARTIDIWSERLGRTLTQDDVEPLTWALTEAARAVPAPNFLTTLQYAHNLGRRLAAFWQSYDILITPTHAQPPPELGQCVPGADNPLLDWTSNAPYGVYTLPFNMSGQPAISLPLGRSESGLPLGTQLVAAAGREDLLLRVASQIEQAQPWAGNRPDLFG